MYKDRGDSVVMYTEVPTLPIVCSDGHRRTTRKLKKTTVNNVNRSSPRERGPYKDSMRVHCVSEPTVRGTCKNTIGQRIISAKILRVKELQNQLTDAHYHLNELANENRLLKALQKRQDSALKRYEGTNAELPRIIHSHHEELKVLHIKYKQLKAQHKQTCDLLKEKESEIHSLQSQNKHLLRLSKDQHLGEREQLKMQVSDLKHQIEQQHETIQTLNRKLTLESKKFKHQLHSEVTKHRDTRKQLNETLEKLKTLEELLNNREKRLYGNGRLPVFNNMKPSTSQSMTNLENNSEFLKASNRSKETSNELKNKSLPKLLPAESVSPKLALPAKPKPPVIISSETMTSLEQVRKFRLPKSAHSARTRAQLFSENNAGADGDDETEADEESEKLERRNTTQIIDSLNSTLESADEEIKDIMDDLNTTVTDTYKVPEELIKEFGYTSSNNDDDHDNQNHLKSPTSKSKNLHARLINSSINSVEISKKEPEPLEVPLNEKKSVERNHRRPSISRRNSSVPDIPKTDLKCDGEIKLPRASIDDFHHKQLESNQERLLNITKSWTELQTKLNNKESDLSMGENKLKHDDLLDYFSRDKSEINIKSQTDDDDQIVEAVRNSSTNIDRRKSNSDLINGTTNDVELVESYEKFTKLPDDDTKSCEKINFNKQKLLAAMKAIDDNENIEIISNQKIREATNAAARSQVTENLYRGLPTHTRRRDDIIKDIFADTKVETKLRSGCSKLH